MKGYTIAIIAIAAIIGLFIILALTSKKTTVNNQGQTVTTQSGWLEALAGIFGGAATGLGGGNNGGSGGNWWNNLFGNKPKKYCDCAKPGYAADGIIDSLCNEGSVQFEKDCVK